MTMQTLFENFEGTISQKKVFRCAYTSNSNNLKICKLMYLKKISGVHVVVDYMDTALFRTEL